MKRKDEKDYDYDLPMLIRGWRINFAEAKLLTVILDYRPRSFNPSMCEYQLEWQANKPELAGMEDVYEIAKVMHLGDIIGSRPFLFASAQDAIGSEGQRKTREWAVAWAIELADRHMAETHPDFETARQRMVDAYGRLFELEQTLRLFVEQTLTTKHGDAWWDGVHPSTKVKVEKREQDPTKKWFDDYSISKFKFADFDDLRLTVEQNWQDFKDAFGGKDTFHALMVPLSHARDRVAHCNTLSTEDFTEFMYFANKILDMIRPRTALR